MVTLEGEVLRTTYESETSGFRIVRLGVPGRSEPVTLVGVFPRVYSGATLRATGVWEKDPTHGEQLRVSGVTVLEPKTALGLEKYLGSGVVPGIGPSYAKRIVEAFGQDTLRVLDEAPERLYEVAGLGKKRIAAVVDAWRENRALHDVMVFLQANGVSPGLAARIVRRYGPRAAQIVSDEPYRLALEVAGIGFRTADRIAESVGVARDSPLRHQAGLLQTLRDETDRGHTFTHESSLFVSTRELLQDSVDDASLVRALGGLVHGGHAVVDAPPAGVALALASLSAAANAGHEEETSYDAGTGAPTGEPLRHVYTTDVLEAEARLARRFVALVKSPPARTIHVTADERAEVERGAGVPLSEEQRLALDAAIASPVLVITGGPGVGKTTLLRAILAMFRKAKLMVRLCAPTGRAAKRMSESSGGEALTIHRLLEVDPKSLTFKRNEENPLEGDAFVVDETSMVDVRLADSLLRAIPDGKRLVLVGDVDQLPSVGPGNVLFDVIASQVVPVVRLTRIFRQGDASRIVLAAHAINRGEFPESGERGEDADFFVVPSKDAQTTAKLVEELVVTRIPRKFGFDPVRDVQVLTPMNKGPLGALALNDTLQAVLNPGSGGLTRRTRTFRVRDKVMQIRNNYDTQVYNGDVGVVTQLLADEAGLVVSFGERDVTYERGALDDLVLAYACTIHKSQGSEYPAVVIPLSSSHFVMLAKNLVYTAVTRGRKLVVLVCEPRALQLALSPDRWREDRRTGLAWRLVYEVTRPRSADA